MKNLIIIGASGFGREVLNWVQDHSRNNVDWIFKGYLDTRTSILDGFSSDPSRIPDAVPYLPEVQAQFRREVNIIGNPLTYLPGQDDIFLCAIGEPSERQKYAQPILDKGGYFFPLVHPTAQVSPYVSIGPGTLIGPFVSISPDVTIGKFVTVNSYTGIAHDVVIGDWCEIDGHCLIAGRAMVGNCAKIHGGAVITPDTRIGEGATVSAGSVVFGKVPPGVTVIGNPAKKFDFGNTRT